MELGWYGRPEVLQESDNDALLATDRQVAALQADIRQR
jgi:hypothetical protein